MSDHDELADRLEEDADRLEHESDQLSEQGQSARDAAEQAQSDEYTPAPLGEKDPGYREAPEGEGEEDDEESSDPRLEPEKLGVPPEGHDDDEDNDEDGASA